MNVKDQIDILKKVISSLEELDPETEVAGHVDYPDGCYSGDVSGEIYKIDVEPYTEDGTSVILGVYYK